MGRRPGLRTTGLGALLVTALAGSSCDGPNRGERLRLIAVDIYDNRTAECYAINQCSPGSCPELPYFIGAYSEACLQGLTAEMYATEQRFWDCWRIASEEALRCAEQCIIPCPYEPTPDCRGPFDVDPEHIPAACLPPNTPSTTPTVDAGAPPVSDSAETHRTYCEYLDRCYPEALESYPGGTLAGCLGVPECQHWYDYWLQTSECREFLSTDACTVPLARPTLGNMLLNFPAGSPCAPPEIFADFDRQAEGERCIAFDQSCNEGLYCQLDLPATTSGSYFCGTCTQRVALGDSCADGQACETGAYCEDERCVAALANGEPCERGSQCQSALCLGECIDPTQIFLTGAPLTTDGDALGEACDASRNPCVLDWTLACVNGRCVRKPDEGDACDDSFEDCRIGQGCDAGRCVTVPCLAEPSGFCGGPTRCPSGWYCGTEQHCIRLPGPGESCEELGVCGTGLVCLDKQCIAPPSLPNGTPCREDAQCRSRRCVRNLTPYCEVNASSYTCEIPACDTDCGVCGDELGLTGCGQ